MPVKRTVTREELAQPTVPYEQAIAQVRAAFTPLPPIRMPLGGALGMVLAEDVVADIDVPGFASSAMDGYAVRSTDLAGASETSPVRLRLAGDVPAGAEPGAPVEPGACSKIMTGGPIPPGADAIVPWEDTEALGPEIAIFVEQPAGKHVRPAGEDMRAGARALDAGTTLRALHLGVLAMLGRTEVRVHHRPRLSVLSTGEELVQPGLPLRAGQVYDSNQTLLGALAEAAGGIVVRSGTVGDDPDAVATWLREASAISDLIVTSGGASVGEHDWMRAVLARDGELMLWRVAMKPGKPIVFARVAGVPVLALPGNPGSVYACAHTFMQPAVRALGGREAAPRAGLARLSESVKGSPSRTTLCRVTLDGEVATPLPAQSSVVLSNLLPTHAYAIVPPGGLPEGAEVRVEHLA